MVVGTVSALRRLMFDAQTLAVLFLKSQVEGGESSKKELVPAERSERIRKQKQKLVGYDLTGPLECSHGSYDLVLEMAEKDAIFYLQPHKFLAFHIPTLAGFCLFVCFVLLFGFVALLGCVFGSCFASVSESRILRAV